MHEITWPDHAILTLNGERIEEFKPIPFHSSLKKRKDDQITFNSKYLHLIKIPQSGAESSNLLHLS